MKNVNIVYIYDDFNDLNGSLDNINVFYLLQTFCMSFQLENINIIYAHCSKEIYEGIDSHQLLLT